MDATEPGRAPRRWTVEAWVLIALVTVPSVLRLDGRQLAPSVWMDRDLTRALAPWGSLDTAGAELSFGTGARVPGVATQVLFKLLQTVDPDALAVYRGVLCLDLVAWGVLGLAAWRWLGPLAAAVALAVVAGSGVVVDDLLRLWNPALVPLWATLATVSALGATTTRDARWVVPMAVGLAVGAQLHLSVALLAIGLTTGVAVARPVGARWWGVAAAVVGVLYAPYLLSELASGWANTRAMADQPMAQALAGAPQPVGSPWADVVAFVERLGGTQPVPGWLAGRGSTVRALASLAPVWAWLGALAVVVAPWRAEGRRFVALVAPMVLALVVYAADPALSLDGRWDTRYLHAFLPAWGLLVGWGIERTVARIPEAGRGWATLGVVALAAIPAWLNAGSVREYVGSPGVWDERARDLAALQEHTGWTLPEVVRRTVWVDRRDDLREWHAEDGVEHLLVPTGASFAGSAAPPCAVLVTSSEGEAGYPTEDELQAMLRQHLTGLAILERVDLPHRRAVLYRHDGPCTTSMANRYLDTPDEVALSEGWQDLSDGVAVAVPAPRDGVQRAVVRLDDPTASRDGVFDLLVGVDLWVAEGRVHATLHSAQLRGHAYNQGLLKDALVAAPRLELVGEGETTVLSWAPGLVGVVGALTPLTASAGEPSGPWTAVLVLDQVAWDGSDAGWADQLSRTPRRVSLGTTGTGPDEDDDDE